jgi:ABC-type transport system involved in multi-copper enzyme maturation permease subunit
MDLPAVVYTIRLLVRDTFRQAVASSVFWVMLAFSGLCILVCLSVSVRGDQPLRHPGEPTEFLPHGFPVDPQVAARSGVDLVSGDLTVGFGAVRLELGRDAEDAVRFFQLLLAGGVADTMGILLALLWTAGFVPGFLEPASAAVLLVKPVPRWALLAGKYLGVLAFVAVQAALFVGGTWVALGLKTGIWHTAYLWCVPILVLHFAVFFSFSALVGVCTRSTVACVVSSLALWFVCWGTNVAHLAHLAGPEQGLTPARFLTEAGYWILPKPAEVNFLLQQALDSSAFFARLPEFNALAQRDAVDPVSLVLTSAAFIAVMLTLAGRRLVRMDY